MNKKEGLKILIILSIDNATFFLLYSHSTIDKLFQILLNFMSKNMVTWQNFLFTLFNPFALEAV